MQKNNKIIECRIDIILSSIEEANKFNTHYVW